MLDFSLKNATVNNFFCEKKNTLSSRKRLDLLKLFYKFNCECINQGRIKFPPPPSLGGGRNQRPKRRGREGQREGKIKRKKRREKKRGKKKGGKGRGKMKGKERSEGKWEG